MSESVREPPAGLRDGGRALWAGVLAGFELRGDEELILLHAAREVDLIDGLQEALDRDGVTALWGNRVRVHPAAAEIRAHRGLLAKLLAQLSIPAEDDRDRDRGGGRPGSRGVYRLVGRP